MAKKTKKRAARRVKPVAPVTPAPRYVAKFIYEYTPETIAIAKDDQQKMIDAFNSFICAYADCATGPISMGSYFTYSARLHHKWQCFKDRVVTACAHVDKNLWHTIEKGQF